MSQKTKLCKYFPYGSCMYGSKCKFLHDSSTSSQSYRNEKKVIKSEISESQDAYRQWRYNVPLSLQQCRPLGSQISSFFQTACRLVEAEPEMMQLVITQLASEGGLLRVKELCEQLQTSPSPQLRSRSVEAAVIPFFRALTCPDVLNSLVLETHVSQIYVFIFGVNGSRAVQLFSVICETLAAKLGEDQDVAMSLMEPSLAVLRNLVDKNTLASIQEPFVECVRQLQDVFTVALEKDDPRVFSVCQSHLEHILRRLDIGLKFSTASVASSKTVGQVRTAFTVYREPPGGRHDNDFQDISDIQIFPTAGEVSCSKEDYLPETDPLAWHLPGTDGLLDRNFRLLREENIGPLRDAIRQELQHRAQWTGEQSSRRTDKVRTLVHGNATIDRVFLERQGFVIDLRLPLPAPLRQLSKREREEWWIRTKRLQVGALVSLMDADGLTAFCEVSEPPQTPKREQEDRSLWFHNNTAVVRMALVEQTESNVQWILDHIPKSRCRYPLSIIEFPGIILGSFEPILKAIQAAKQDGNLPFAEILVPSNSQGIADVPPPEYIHRLGFQFDLSTLLKDPEPLYFDPRAAFDVEHLVSKSSLDRAQASSLLSALSHRFSLIQGPPGTGKSYTGVALIKTLLASKKSFVRPSSSLGPILCVCYTNHALDQLLEELLKITGQIVRIGSSSKSDLLQDHNLLEVSKKIDRTKCEKHEIWEEIKARKQSQEDFQHIVRQYRFCASAGILARYLERHDPDQYNVIFGVDKDGFREVGSEDREKALKRWLEHETRQRSKTSGEKSSILKRRQELYQEWLQIIKEPIESRIHDITSIHQVSQTKLNYIYSERDMRCLREADIIGVTTSGLARKIEVLRRVNTRIMLCEEAGEVLEPHLLTALLPSIEHVILIGDHRQLRPQVKNFELSQENPASGRRYCLDVSLFERLVEPLVENTQRLSYSTLQIQRRMHPSISNLIRQTLYPDLQDHHQVSEYAEVSGMKQRLFWLNHQMPELNKSDDTASTSHYNEYEVEMVSAIVTHLSYQGVYKSGEIAVLTPYLQQMFRLRRRLETSFAVAVSERDQLDLDNAGILEGEGQLTTKVRLRDSIRIATVDNFQGEEAKVVVISLVRSNANRRVGFLRTENRINVLLSRAKHGMYIVGNAETASSVPMWAQVIGQFEVSNNIGSELELCCPRHPDTAIAVSEPDHFSIKSPEGGCNLPCAKRLSCGHACMSKCHSDLVHSAVRCLEPCQRPLKGCEHSCLMPCGDACPKKCAVDVFDPHRRLQCGHEQRNLPCWQSQDISLVLCNVYVKKIVPGCGHDVELRCHQDPTKSTFKCPSRCSEALSCGHNCQKRCSECRTRADDGMNQVEHGKCMQKCGRQFSSCAHACREPCHIGKACPPCKAKCENRCEHSACQKSCSEPCAPCAEEKCHSSCPHTACSLPCAAPCDHVPCSRRCEKVLSCSHRCPSVCGKICPEVRYCQVCASEEITSRVVDFIEGNIYKDIDLEKMPCIFPRCGHFFSIQSMDGVMDMPAHYEIEDRNGVETPIAIKSASLPFSGSETKTRLVCPECRGSLRDVARYGKLVRRAILDESTQKMVVWTNSAYVPLSNELQQRLGLIKSIESKNLPRQIFGGKDIVLNGDRSNQVSTMGKVFSECDEKGWKAIKKFRNELLIYRDRVKTSEQPFAKVRNIVEAIRRRGGSSTSEFSFDHSVLQLKGQTLANSMLLRFDIALLMTFLSLKKPSSSATVNTKVWRGDMLSFHEEAVTAKRAPQQVEAYIYLAQLCAIQRSRELTASAAEQFCLEGAQYVANARAVCTANSAQTAGLEAEVEAVEQMLKTGTFYAPVSSEERMAVVNAMRQAIGGSGRWYYCVNGHPFTIGECGRPMQTATCPECSAPVGGEQHELVAGVSEAEDLQRDMGELRVV